MKVQPQKEGGAAARRGRRSLAKIELLRNNLRVSILPVGRASMTNTRLRVLIFGWLIFATAGAASASQFVLILHNEAGWQFQGADKVTIDGKPKFRRGSGPATEISQDAYKRLPEDLIGSVPLRLHRKGYFLVRNAGNWEPLFPDGVSVKGAASAPALWSAAQVVIQADRGSKEQAMRTSEVFAILPGSATPAEAAVTFLSDESNFRGAGEASATESFDERMSLLVGIAGVATGPAQAKLQAMLSEAMSSALQRANGATGRFTALMQGLQYVPVAEKAFPSDANLAKLNAALRDRLAWLNQRMAIVKALGAGTEWDSLIVKYADKNAEMGGLEDYDDAFPDLSQLRDRSTKESETFHTNEAKRLYALTPKQCIPAQEQVRLAQARNPGSRDLDALSNEIRLGCLGEKTTVTVGKPVATPAQTTRVTGYITSAGRYMADGKFDDAEAEIKSAEAVFAGDPRIVLTRAKLLRARKSLKAAIDMLNQYDLLVSSDAAAMDQSAALRADIEYDIKSGRETARAAAAKAEIDGDYPVALSKAVEGLGLDPGDPELLYRAGLDAAITRDVAAARGYWQTYLSSTQSQASENKRRTEVRGLLTEIAATPTAAAGAPNWFSGQSQPAGLAYDPVSLAPNFRPFEIKSSKKQTTEFDWKGSSLNSVKTTTLDPGARPVTVYFDYNPGEKGVRRVSMQAFDDKDTGTVKLTAAGAMGAGKGTYVALFNNPGGNPYLIEKLTGRRVGTIVAGNPYFNPFVWTDVYSFLAEYDADGRVKSATPLKGAPGAKPLDFQWDGNRLISITERGGDYRRDLHYNGGQLTDETIVSHGKTSKIEYKYNGGRVVEANCGDDFSLDGRSRHVLFGN